MRDFTRNQPSPLTRRQRGLSLIELMVSLVIGLVVVGAVLAAYVGSGTSSRHTQALTQITEDASVAMNVIRAQLSMAGYSRPLSVSASNQFTRAYGGPALYGCDSAFRGMANPIDALDCDSARSASDSIAMAFEADSGANGNSVTSGGIPLDCLGNALPRSGVPPDDYYLSYSRFYVDQPAGASARGLYCLGPGNASAQALVENIERMEILYGVAAVDGSQVLRYVQASELARSDFARVVSVRLCVVVASSGPVMDAVTAYQGCDPFAAMTLPADRRMYRAFTSTMVLHNRLRNS